MYIYVYTGHWSIVRPDWYSPAPTAPNSRLETHGSPDHRQPCPWVGDPVRAGACLQSGKDSSPVNSATPLAEDGDPVRRPRSESQCRPDCGDCARLVAMARLPDCCWFHSSPVFFQHLHFARGCLPDCGCCPTARLGRHDLAASGRSVRQTGAPRQPPWPESVGLLPDSNNFPTARLCLLPDCPIGFCSPNTRLHVPDCYPTILQWPVYIYIYIYIYHT